MLKPLATTLLVTAGLLAGARGAAGQSAILNLPRASQHARVTQRVGLTDITVDYHRPLVGGRRIFGGLQAYGQVWRAGANENTTFEVSDAVAIDGHPLAKGLYGLHMIPGEHAWTVIFSRNATAWGSFTYDEAEDVLRVTVTPRAVEHREALTYDFDDPTPTSVGVTMRWATVAVPFTVTVDTPAITERSLRNQLRGRAQFEWSPWMEAANYLLANHLSAADALADADASIQIEDRFENEITKSRALTVLGRPTEAAAARAKAVALGTQLQIQVFARGLQADGRQDEALDLFRLNVQKDPTSWVGHNNAARLAVAKGDFVAAIAEMKLAEAGAPDSLKAAHADLVRRLLDHEDINR